MKRLIAFILVLSITLGMVVSVSAAYGSSFSRTLRLIQTVRSLFAPQKEAEEVVAETELMDLTTHPHPSVVDPAANTLTIYVAPYGNDANNGAEDTPYATIEAARDAIRAIDKSKYDGIVVVLKSGEYRINNTIVFTAEDSGTKVCPITYIGEDGTILCGGVSFDHTAFTKGEGQLTQYFPEEAKDKIVILDLKDYGFTVEQIEKLLATSKSSYQAKAPVIAVNGTNMTLARFPNNEWISMEHGQFYDANGNPTSYTDNDRHIPKEQQAHTTRVEYGDDYFETVTSWHSCDDIFVEGRFTHLWVHDNSEVVSINYETDQVTVPYVGAYFPNEGGLLYFYNIPEELDVPGEYIVDRDCILYYYPEEGFEDARFTMAVLDENMISISSDYVTFDNLILESGRRTAIQGEGNNLYIQNCIIRDFADDGIVLTAGYNNYLYANELYSIGDEAISVTGGDKVTLKKANTVICNNYIHDYGHNDVLGYAITNSGCGITVCHNECAYSDTLAMDSGGPYHTIEYNYIHDVAQFFSDGGAIGDGSSLGYGTVFRYNLVENAGTADYPAVSQLGVQAFTVDCDASGLTIYSNIVHNITGSGVGISGGRDHDVHNNLFISCGAWALSLDARDMTSEFRAGTVRNKKMNELYTNSAWQKAFPELVGIHGNYDPKNPFDVMYEGAPANVRFYDNYGLFDKSNRFTTTKVMDYVYLNYDDEIINKVAEIEILLENKGNMRTYNSRRNTINYIDALAEAEAAGYPIMTVEQYNQIGRIGVGPNAAK